MNRRLAMLAQAGEWNNDIEKFRRFWRKDGIVYDLWHAKKARKLATRIRYRGRDYNADTFYFNSFINEKLCYFKYVEGSWIFDPEDEPVPPKPLDLHGHLSFPYYEVDKELQYDRQRLSIKGRTTIPVNVTKFIEPYNKKFYCHTANPALPDIETAGLY